LEDDHVTAVDFLTFMNRSLQKYADEKDVACITGYVYPLKTKFTEAFFLYGADCWGWATWSDRWNILEKNAGKLIDQINERGLKDNFDFNGSYPYMQMLQDKKEGKNQSWAILWYASAFLNNMFCLYPPYSLLYNTGNDGSGTHAFTSSSGFDTKLQAQQEIQLPEEIKESSAGRKAFEQFFNSIRPKEGNSGMKGIWEKFRSVFK
jgi:hypothetical protein